MIMMEVTELAYQEALQRPQDGLDQLNKVCLKSRRNKKNSMTGPGQPRTCSYPNASRSPPGGQVIFFLLFSCICIHRILGSDLLSVMEPFGYFFIVMEVTGYFQYFVSQSVNNWLTEECLMSHAINYMKFLNYMQVLILFRPLQLN